LVAGRCADLARRARHDEPVTSLLAGRRNSGALCMDREIDVAAVSWEGVVTS
jgi:hypothetical protein